MVNTQLLDKKIKDSGLYIKHIIETIGISRNGFDKKRKGKTPFRKSEIFVLSHLLKLSEEEESAIFHAD